MSNVVSPPAEGGILSGTKAEDKRDDETGNCDSDAEAGEDEIRIFAPPCGIPTFQVELEQPSNVDAKRCVSEVVVTGPLQGPRHGNSRVDTVQDAGAWSPYILVEPKKPLLVHTCLDMLMHLWHYHLTDYPSETEDSTNQKAPGETRIQLEHVVGAKRAEEDDG